MASNWKLSPSDFAFLWRECRRCFYLKVVHGFNRPMSPMPAVFNKIDSIMKRYFAGKPTSEIAPELPAGTVAFGEKQVESAPIHSMGSKSTCFIRGRFDCVVRFDDGSYGVIDFKTTSATSRHLSVYKWQLHSYAYALENPAPAKLNLAPVSRLGLLCVEPVDMLGLGEGGFAYKARPAWIDCPRNDEAFMEFIGEVLDVLDRSEPPQGSPTCGWCQYRDEARRNLL